jgi:uncharacterized membrane protein HdeD (DUF308 family)
MSRSTILLMRGAVGVTFGLLALAWPGLTILTLIGIFAGYALLDGIITLWLGLTSTPTEQRPWAPTLRGMLGIVAGIFTFLWPSLTTLALLLVIAAWAVMTGVLEIIAAFMFRRVIADERHLALSGILSIAFGLLLSAFPALGLLGIAWALAAYALASGIVLIALGFRLRRPARVQG